MTKQSRQQKKTKTSPWWWRSCRSAIKWFAGFVFLGIATQLFGGVFSAWAIAIKNASQSFLQKFADTYFIRAATTELTDSASGISIIVFILLFSGVWIFVKFLETEQGRIEEELDRNEDNDKKSDLNSMIKELQTLRKQQVLELKNNAAKGKKDIKWIKWLFIVCAVFSCYGMSLQEVAYALVKIYRKDIIRVRPFITDSEFHKLNRQWVMMKSFRDYKDIAEKISEYEKRAGTDKNPDLENE